MNTHLNSEPKNQTRRFHGTGSWPNRFWKLERGRMGLALAFLLATGNFVMAAQSDIVPDAINYQGRLMDSLGNPLRGGPYQLQFKIWNNPDDGGIGSYVWGKLYAVHVATNGMFNVLLDNSGGSVVTSPGVPPVTDILQAFDAPGRWLGVSIAGNPDGSVAITNEIKPRQRLISAPFAIHSYNTYLATWAAIATNAYNASTGVYATNAGNATNLSFMTTNDLLWVTKPTQTLKGTLAITNNLYVTNSLYVKGPSTLAGPLAVSGSSTFSGALTNSGVTYANGGLSVPASASLKCANTNFIVIQNFKLPNMVNIDASSNPSTNTYVNTGFSTTDWAATIAGYEFSGDVNENGVGSPFLRLKMAITNSNWYVLFNFYHSYGLVTNINVDVMFIRKELAKDNRAL